MMEELRQLVIFTADLVGIYAVFVGLDRILDRWDGKTT